MSAEVWNAPGVGFGDLWASLQFCLRRAETTQAPVYISSLLGRLDVTARLHEMLALIDSAHCVIPVRRPATADMHLDCFGVKYFPCKIRWKPSDSRIITHQFDGVSSAELKNPPPSDVVALESTAAREGHQLTRVGLPWSMAECALAMAQSKAFVGACSGMALLAHSVGVPTYVLEYGIGVRWWHGQNPITICQGMPDFLRSFPWH